MREDVQKLLPKLRKGQGGEDSGEASEAPVLHLRPQATLVSAGKHQVVGLGGRLRGLDVQRLDLDEV